MLQNYENLGMKVHKKSEVLQPCSNLHFFNPGIFFYIKSRAIVQ